MTTQVKFGAQRQAAGRSPLGRRLAAGLLTGLVALALVPGGIVSAVGDSGGEPNLLAVLGSEARMALSQGQRFLSDLRLLYQISQLERLNTEAAATPAAAPAAPRQESDCKLIAAEKNRESFKKPVRTRL